MKYSTENKQLKHCDKCWKEHSPQFCPERPAPEINRIIDCLHNKNHTTYVDIDYIEDKKCFMANIKIICDNCGMPFEFIGVEAGMMWDRPMASPDAQTLRIPIKPKGSTILPAIPGFKIKAQ